MSDSRLDGLGAALLGILTVVTVGVPAGPSRAAATEQQRDYRLVLRDRTSRMVTLAVPHLEAGPDAAAVADELHRVLWDDLHHSMVFELIPRERYPGAGRPSDDPQWAVWQATGAEALLFGTVRSLDGEILVELRLYDVESGRQVVGRRYSAVRPSRARNVAHAFADEAVLYYTGVAGVAATQVAFVSNRAGPKEIFIMDYDGFAQRRITYDSTINLSPSFSPGGDRIAYVSYRRHGNVVNPDLYMLFKGGGVPQAITRVAGLNSAPSWNPAGDRIAFASSRAGNPEIYVARPDGDDARRLTNHHASDTSPTWSPNGRQIAFTSDRSGAPQIYVMDADGANVRRLTRDRGWKDDAAWRPIAGDLIAYTASTGRNSFDIFVYDLTSDRTVRLTHGPGRNEAPAWSADGRQIVFESTRGGATQLYAMGLDGSRLRALTTEGNNFSPSWGARP